MKVSEMNSGDLKPIRPEPIKPGIEAAHYNREASSEKSIDALVRGEYFLVNKYYSDGLELLHKLYLHLSKIYPNKSYLEQREFRSEYNRLSNQIVAEVLHHKLSLMKAPVIGWLERLYPETNHFLLPFTKIQGLNSAWQWYLKGVRIPLLRNRIHPYYGVYFPTRYDHLNLLDNWLKRYQGPKKSAIDIGIGCGVISLMLMKYGFQKSYGTDINPNVIIGLSESMSGTKLSRKIELDYGHLFGKWEQQTELILFNPPWLPISEEMNQLDEAIYYNRTLFAQFFEEAIKRILPEGRVVLLFSNLGQITNVTNEHPIEKELMYGDRFILEKCLKKSVKAASEKTKRDQYWRSNEKVELWVLKAKQ